MSWIEEITPEQATGLLRQLYDASIQRAGRVWKIISVMSVNPSVMRDNIKLYTNVMIGKSPLTRVQREMLATVVSWELECYY